MEWKVIMGVVSSFFVILNIFTTYYFQVKNTVIKNIPDAVEKAEVVGFVAEEKFANAVEQVTSLIPPLMKPFIPSFFIKKAVQLAFDKIDAYAKKQVKK